MVVAVVVSEAEAEAEATALSRRASTSPSCRRYSSPVIRPLRSTSTPKLHTYPGEVKTPKAKAKVTGWSDPRRGEESSTRVAQKVKKTRALLARCFIQKHCPRYPVDQ